MVTPLHPYGGAPPRPSPRPARDLRGQWRQAETSPTQIRHAFFLTAAGVLPAT
jgi:hypothetical protein